MQLRGCVFTIKRGTISSPRTSLFPPFTFHHQLMFSFCYFLLRTPTRLLARRVLLNFFHFLAPAAAAAAAAASAFASAAAVDAFAAPASAAAASASGAASAAAAAAVLFRC